MKRSLHVTAIAAITATALLLAGCGGSESPEASQSSVPEKASGGAPRASSVEKRAREIEEASGGSLEIVTAGSADDTAQLTDIEAFEDEWEYAVLAGEANGATVSVYVGATARDAVERFTSDFIYSVGDDEETYAPKVEDAAVFREHLAGTAQLPAMISWGVRMPSGYKGECSTQYFAQIAPDVAAGVDLQEGQCLSEVDTGEVLDAFTASASGIA